MESFFKEAIASIQSSGTIRPSSRYLIRACLKDLVFSDAKTIIEFGTGDGCITAEIVTKMSPKTNLYSFEINPKFFAHCQNKFSLQKNTYILNVSALDFDSVLKKDSINEVDYIISSLPLTLLKESEIDVLLNKVLRYLKKGGIFVQYQYSLGKYRRLKKIFDKVDVDLTIRNLPPAFIYKCYNK